MLRKLTLSAAGALALGLALTFGTSMDAWGKGPGHRGHGPRLERAIESLDLDEAKRAELFGVIDAARPAGRELREQMRAARKEMRALLEDPAASEEAILAKAEQIGALATEMRKHHLRTLLDVRSRLSADQKAQLSEALGKRGGKFGHCAGRGERRHVL
ncbi:MAG TPA: Spy/CpxP family protein refolding chaperone [Myxococcota bacterium]